MDLYVNGVDDGGSYSGTGGSLSYSTGSSFIGGRGGSTMLFDGAIDDVRVYNRALSGEEIQGLMHTWPDTSDPTLLGYWDFDEGEGQQAADLSLYGNHGQLGSTLGVDSSDPDWGG